MNLSAYHDRVGVDAGSGWDFEGGEQEMTDEQLVTKYLKVAHELAMLPHGIGWTPEVGRRREELERQVETMRPQIDVLHRKYERSTNEKG